MLVKLVASADVERENVTLSSLFVRFAKDMEDIACMTSTADPH